MRVEKNAASPAVITQISKTFTAISTVRLLTASARWPEYPENSRNGTTNTAPAKRQIFAAGPVRRDVHGPQRNDDLIDVVVERAQELRPQERLETAVLQKSLEAAVPWFFHDRFSRKRKARSAAGDVALYSIG